ncbi:MAG: type 4a pilus biogenesis protein PilO [Deltaproteobacteria bacterium]|nr:type 4a pilus biogenesis protein PilO [Deltaproteobacteria bacterium]
MNPRLEKLLKRPLYQRIGVLAAILLGIASLFYFFLYMPAMEELDQLQRRRISLQAKLEEDRKMAANLKKFQDEYERMQGRLELALTELPNEKEIPTLLTTISALAKDNGLDVLKFKPGAEQPQGFYAAVPVELSLVGNYHQVASFFSDVGSLSRIVNVGNLKMGKPRASGGVMILDVDCLATTYRFLDAGTAAPPAAGRKGAPARGRR